MQGFGYLLALVGFVVLVVGLFQRAKAKRLADAPFVATGDAGRNGLAVAAKNGAISAQGQVRCPQPVITPMSGQPALYYKLEVTAEWKEREQWKSRVIETQEVAALFSIDDGSGEVWIDAKKGGSFAPIVTRAETQGTGLLGGITGQELMFGNHRVHAGIMSIGTKFTVRESFLPLESRLYVCGKVGDRSITSPSWRSLLISNKTRAELFESAEKWGKYLLMGGGGAFATGVLFGVLGAIFFPIPDQASTATTTAATTTASAIEPAPRATPTTVAAVATAKPKGHVAGSAHH